MPTVEDLEQRNPGRGRTATTPREIPPKGWKDILWRVYGEIQEDRVSLVAAGATFYLLLALFPAMAAFVSVFGLVADPATISNQISAMDAVLPAGGLDLIEQRLESLASQDITALSFGFLGGLVVALYSATNAIKTLFQAMNIAYDEMEKRGFIRLNLVALAFALGAVLMLAGLILIVGVVPAVIALVPLGRISELVIWLVRWPVLFLAAGLALAVIYRYAPSRKRAEWRWVSWGSAVASVVWVLSSVTFSYYLENFGSYDATYGSLGAVIGFMMWMWISVFILIAGAELNSEMEHQTAQDTTRPPEQPLGQRGAVMADSVGKTANEPNPGRGHAFTASPYRRS